MYDTWPEKGHAIATVLSNNRLPATLIRDEWIEVTDFLGRRWHFTPTLNYWCGRLRTQPELYGDLFETYPTITPDATVLKVAYFIEARVTNGPPPIAGAGWVELTPTTPHYTIFRVARRDLEPESDEGTA